LRWKGRRVFVTGGTGLLGGWLIRELLDQQAEVVALVRDGSPRSMLVQEGILDLISVVRGSLEDFDLIRRALSEYEPATVFHLAAQSIVGTAKRDPLSTLQANIHGTWNVLEASRQASVRQVLVASSDKAYGDNPDLPYRETHALQGHFPYDVSKSCADLICGMYAVTYGLPVAVLRCANLFGGGDLNFSRLIPDLIRATLDGERFVIRSDGKFVRDFLYVRDAALAYLCLAERLNDIPSLAGQAFNFSLEVRATVLEIVEKTLVLMGRPDLQPVIQNQASNEIREQYLSCQKAHRTLAWSPRYSLEDGLRETIDWYRRFFDVEVGAATYAGG
jgi:CDP-glucose 4,6-dehydratase